MTEHSIHPAIALIENRISANYFDTQHVLTSAQVQELAALACRAPSAYNLQNWRLVAVQSQPQKALLRRHAWDQAKISDAAVTFIVCGQLPDEADLPARFQPFVEVGHIAPAQVAGLQAAAQAQYAEPRTARDEAIRSASLAAMTLMLAAGARGLVSCPLVGFDADAVARAFGLAPGEIPVMLVAVGQAAPGNWPQKPRRPLAQVLEIA